MTTLLNLISVAAGGAVGSLARYLITVGAVSVPGGTTLVGTTIANVLGCAAIGAFGEIILLGHVSPRTQLAVQTGFLGGLTTFSSFALESAVLADTGRWALSGLYVLANLLIGWAALVSAAVIVKGWLT